VLNFLLSVPSREHVVGWVVTLIASVALWLTTALLVPIPRFVRHRLAEKVSKMIGDVGTASNSRYAALRTIYLQNVRALLSVSVPVYVLLSYPSLVVVNGWILQLVAEYTSAPLPFVALSLLLSPHTWIEMLAYSIAAYGSFNATLKLLLQQVALADIAACAAHIVLASLVLFVAAVTEVFTPDILSKVLPHIGKETTEQLPIQITPHTNASCVQHCCSAETISSCTQNNK